MNQEVMKELQKKVRHEADERFVELKQNLVAMIKPSDKICKKHECLDNIKLMIHDVHNFLGDLAVSHGIDPHDMTKETLTMMLEGNEYARTVQRTAEAFKDEETVGFC